MNNNIDYDYDEDLDILHVYSSETKEGVKGCISIGYATIDVSYDNKIIGLEIEEASKIFRISRDILSSLENVDLRVIKMGNVLLIGVTLEKGQTKTNFQINFPIQKTPLFVPSES